jgi:CRISPR-associated protein Cas6
MNKHLIAPPALRKPLLDPVNPVLDLCFPVVRGRTLDVDHGHSLYLALTAACPDLARIPGLGIHAVRGVPDRQRGELILLDDAEVRLRLPAGAAPLVRGLAGAQLQVRRHAITLGEPCGQALAPVSALWARTVTIHFQEPAIGAALAQLANRFAQDFPWGSFRILRPRTIRFEGRQLLGFEMAVRDLPPRASLVLQGQGFGGRRALGCGLFVPFRATARTKAS